MTVRPAASVVIRARNAASYVEGQLAALGEQDLGAPTRFSSPATLTSLLTVTAAIAQHWAGSRAFVRLIDACA